MVHQLGITPRFFSEGIGDLSLIDIETDFGHFSGQWPPEYYDHIPIEWKKIKEDKYGGKPYYLWHGTFRTPCPPRIYDALPEESRTAHVRWLMPIEAAPGKPTVLHLAATGDHGFRRREHLAMPLIASGVGSLSLESAYYGCRKPAGQSGAKLRRVSDLLLLGRATIEESLFLLSSLCNQENFTLGISGISMGGVHATMVASLYPGEIALAPFLAPRSAAAAYCRGALYHATDWKRIMNDSAKKEKEISEIIRAAAQAGKKFKAAKILQSTEQKKEDDKYSQNLRLENAKELSHEISSATAAQWKTVTEWRRKYTRSLQAHLNRVQEILEFGKAMRGFGGVRASQQNDEAAVELLEMVLETFTDVTRFPVPRRPDAAVLVAATEDAYVSRQSVLEMHRHLPGAEVVWVPGGHVSSFLMHHPVFRKSILQSFRKLNPNFEYPEHF